MAFSAIAASDVDSDSPITDTLMGTVRTNFDDHETRILAVEDSGGPYILGDFLIKSMDTLRSTTAGQTTYTKLKEYTIDKAGALRIKFKLSPAAGGNTVFGRIYKNGAAVGTEQSTSSGAGVTFSEDFSGLVTGDLIQVYAKVAAGSASQIENFRLYADRYETPTTTFDQDE